MTNNKEPATKEDLEETVATIETILASVRGPVVTRTWEEEQAELKKDHERLRARFPHWSVKPYKRECRHCGDVFYANYPLARYCYYDCKIEAFKKVRKERSEESRKDKVCQYCQKTFDAKRAHTKYCSESHRVLACYARKKKMIVQSDKKIPPP